MAPEMAQEPIGQRIKFLIDSQKISVRRFAQTLDVGETNIRNYIDKGTKPSSDILEKIAHAFPLLNLAWLITGEGEPFFSLPTENRQLTTNEQKKFSHSQVIGTNSGTANQNQGKHQVFLSHSHDDVAMLQALVEQLRSQLADKERTIQILLNQQSKP